ncbi:MAG: hypothetical protein R3D25_12795 [Geminicoccaceae bacterium]
MLLVDRLDRLAEGIRIARHTRRIAQQSVVAGMALSTAGMIVAALGHLSPVAGALVQEVIDVAVIPNALRAIGGGLAFSPDGPIEPDELRAGSRPSTPVSPALDRLARTAERDGARRRAHGGAARRRRSPCRRRSCRERADEQGAPPEPGAPSRRP